MEGRRNLLGKSQTSKEVYPLEVSKYTVANKILEEPSFSWWDKIYLKRRNCMINAVKYQYWSRTHKFGLELPHSWEEANTIERKMRIDY